jgi:hypothetical protein
MLQEEAQEANTNNVLEPLPDWIPILFSSSIDNSLSEAIKHLETASSHAILGQLTRLEDAQLLLQQRAQVFSVQLEELRSTALRLYTRLAPFECVVSAPQQDLIDCLEASVAISRSRLRSICSEWKAVEKERQESISGSVLLIGRLWNLLQVPAEERFQLSTEDISLAVLKRLEGERKRLIDFQQARFRELYDCHVTELHRLMDGLKWSKERRSGLLSEHDSYTAEGLQFIACQLATLQPRLALTQDLLNLISNRAALIQKMRDFERSASDPARLFRSSFQLLQEEKFRKTALPSLLASEQKIQVKLAEYRETFAEEFVLDDDKAFAQVLDEDAAARYLNEGIFGFDRNREVRLKGAKDIKSESIPRYSRKLSTIGSNSTNFFNPSVSSSTTTTTTLPQRRKLQ